MNITKELLVVVKARSKDPARVKNNYLSSAWCDKMRDDDKIWQEVKDEITAEKSLNRIWGYRQKNIANAEA